MILNKQVRRFARLQDYLQHLSRSYGIDIAAVKLTELQNVISQREYQFVMAIIADRRGV